MELNIPIPKGTRSKAVLKLLNPFLNDLSDTEINIVSTILDMNIKVLTRTNRVNLRDKLKMTKYNFNNYIQFLKKKGIIIQTKDDLILNSRVVTLSKDNSYTISFIEQ